MSLTKDMGGLNHPGIETLPVYGREQRVKEKESGCGGRRGLSAADMTVRGYVFVSFGLLLTFPPKSYQVQC